jgi:DNA-binding transcriptional LysR family regulator
LLGEYRKRFPRVSLHLEERTPERVWEMVARGRFSAGLTRPVRFGEEQGMRMVILRKERLGIVCRKRDPVVRACKELGWAELESHPLIVLARREGVGLHDAVLAGCRAAGFAPRLAHTPSLVGAVMSYVEAGAGWGVVVDSVVPVQGDLRFVPLTPAATVPLALVWQEDDRSPAVERFRDLVLEWKEEGRLWAGAGSSGATGC